MTQSLQAESIDGADAVATLFAATVAIVIATVFVACRLAAGAPLNTQFVTAALACALVALCAGVAVTAGARAAGMTRWPAWAAMVITPAVIVVLAAAGHAGIRLNTNLIAAAAVLAFAVVAWRAIRYRGAALLSDLAAAAVLGAICAVILYGEGYLSPVFLERVAITGTGNQDTLFHSAIAQMLSVYGIPSTGLDGTPWLHYHWASHWLYGGLADVADVRAIRAYQLLPGVFGAAWLAQGCAVLASRLRSRLGMSGVGAAMSWPVALVLALAVIDIIEPRVAAVVGVPKHSLVSESFILAIGGLIATLSLLTLTERASSRGTSPRRLAASFLVAPTVILALSLAKLSVGAIALGAWGWYQLRRTDWPLWTRVAVMIPAGGAGLGAILLTTPRGLVTGAVAGPLGTLWLVLGEFARGGLLVATIWSLVAIPLAVWTLGRLPEDRRGFGRALLEASVVLLVLSVAPLLAMHNEGMGYFLDVQRWTSIPVIAAYATVVAPHVTFGTPRPSTIALFGRFRAWPGAVIVVMAMITLAASVVGTAGMSAKQIMRDVLAVREGGAIIRGDAAVASTPGAARWSVVRALESTPMTRDTAAALFVTDDVLALWAGQPGMTCLGLPFMFTALSSLPQVGAVPPASCETKGFGYETYAGRAGQRTRVLAISEACARDPRARSLSILELRDNAAVVSSQPCRAP